MKTIYEFQKGDEIVRVCPAKEYSPQRMGMFGIDGGIRDRSYIGQKLIFIGVLNGLIYCKRTDKLSLLMFGDTLLELSLDIFDDGWDYYIDPSKLFDGFVQKMDIRTIEDKIKEAIDCEDYELAEKLKNMLNQ